VEYDAIIKSNRLAQEDLYFPPRRGDKAMSEKLKMQELLHEIVTALVDNVDKVEVNQVVGEQAHVFELRVASQDLGQVIGKKGAHASAIRTLMSAIGGKAKKRYILEIVEND